MKATDDEESSKLTNGFSEENGEHKIDEAEENASHEALASNQEWCVAHIPLH